MCAECKIVQIEALRERYKACRCLPFEQMKAEDEKIQEECESLSVSYDLMLVDDFAYKIIAGSEAIENYVEGGHCG